MKFVVVDMRDGDEAVENEWNSYMFRYAEKLKLAYEALPPTADEIAEYLEVLGIKSKPECSESCALADYFSMHADLAPEVDTGLLNFHAKDNEFMFVEGEHDGNQRHLSDFIRNFDNGLYPKLIKEGK